MAKRAHSYTTFAGAEAHWRGFTHAQRQQQAFRESPSAWWDFGYQRFTEEKFAPHDMTKKWAGVTW